MAKLPPFESLGISDAKSKTEAPAHKPLPLPKSKSRPAYASLKHPAAHEAHHAVHAADKKPDYGAFKNFDTLKNVLPHIPPKYLEAIKPHLEEKSVQEFISRPVMDAEMRALSFLAGQGQSLKEAAASVSNFSKESTMNPQAVGDHGKAVGEMQWQGSRQAAFLARYGHPLQEATEQEQWSFFNSELKNGGPKERRAGRLMAGAGTAADMAAILSRHAVRPLEKEKEAALRAIRAEILYAHAMSHPAIQLASLTPRPSAASHAPAAPPPTAKQKPAQKTGAPHEAPQNPPAGSRAKPGQFIRIS